MVTTKSAQLKISQGLLYLLSWISMKTFKEIDFRRFGNKHQQWRRTTISSGRLHYQERTSISEFIDDPATEEDDNLQINDIDDKVALIEKAFECLTSTTLCSSCFTLSPHRDQLYWSNLTTLEPRFTIYPNRSRLLYKAC